MKTLFICISAIFVAFGAKAQSERPLSQLAGVVIINLGAIEREAASTGTKQIEPSVPAVTQPKSVKQTRKVRRRRNVRRSAPRRKITRVRKRASTRRKASNWRGNVLQN